MVITSESPLWFIAIASNGIVQDLTSFANIMQPYVECTDNWDSGSVLSPHISRFQLILLYRLLLNLGEASSRDIYVGSQYSTSTENNWSPNTTESLALSSLRFDRQDGTADEEQGTSFLGISNYR